MASTAWQIQMDFEKAMRAAGELRGIARSMDSNAESMGNTINSIDTSWDGDNSQAYIAKGVKVKGNITETAAGIRKTAEAIEEIAIRTRDAELAAIQIAED